MSFNKTSFLCLIVLMVMTSFIASTALGHSDAQRTANNTASPAVRVVGYIPVHNHPVSVAEVATDRNGDGDNLDPGDGPVPAHSGHVTVTSIEAVASGSDTTASKVKKMDGVTYVTLGTITDESDTNTTKGTEASSIEVRIKFDGSIVEAAGSTHVARTALAETFMTSSALTALSLDKDGKAFSTQGISIGDDYDWWIGTDGKEVAFIITATAGGTAVPTASAKTILRLRVNAGSVFSPQKTVVDGVTSTDVNGFGIEESDVYEFHLVTALPVTPDKAPPTVKITSVPADGSDLPTKGANKGQVVFTFTFKDDSALGDNDSAFTSGDITTTNYTGTPDFTGSGLVYTLAVTPKDPTKPVTVAVTPKSVSDVKGNAIVADDSLMGKWAPKDETPPTVEITAEPLKDSDGNITFIFDFNEPIPAKDNDTKGLKAFTADDIDRVNSNVASIVSTPTAYTEIDPATKEPRVDAYSIKVKPSTSGSVSIQIKIASVTDMSGNALASDYSGTWKSKDDTSQDMVKITGPALLDSLTASENTITITVTPKGGTITNKLASGEVTVSNGSQSGFAYDNATNTATFNVMPTHGAQFVTVSVAAGAVGDSHKNVSKAAEKVFEVAPLITVPAKGYVVIVRDRHKDDTILSDQPTLALPGVPTPAPDIMAVPWEHMPDLKVLFNVAGTGTGGGALILKKAHSQPANKAVNWHSVVINEIMWATDKGILGHDRNDKQANQQWIELYNNNDHDAKVFIYARAGQDILDNSANDVVSPTVPIVDVVTNYFNEKPGKVRWTVPGQDGNSKATTDDALNDFISMARKAINDGKKSDSWAKSGVAYYTTPAYDFIGTPGRVNSFSPATQPHITKTFQDNWGYNKDGSAKPQTIAKTIIFNEIANLSNTKHEWIELRNITGGEINLKHYQISIVKSNPSASNNNADQILYRFPGNDSAKIPAGGVLLLVASEPKGDVDHPLAPGWNVDKSREDQVAGWGDTLDAKDVRYKVAANGFGDGLPDDGNFMLILRSNKGNGYAGTGQNDRNIILDLAGNRTGLNLNPYPNPVSSTELWPLWAAARQPTFGNNKFEVGKVHVRRNVGTKHDIGGAGAVEDNNGKSAFTDIGYSGIGYKRHAVRSAANGGTPGYHSVERSKASEAKLYISEIMLNQVGESRNALPQWIEIYNPTEYAVQLDAGNGWQLVIEEEGENRRTINFKAKGAVKRVLPKQTILVVSSTARSYGSDYLPAATVFPSTRVFNVYRELGGGRYSEFLDPDKFNLRLEDGSGGISDEIGNLDGNFRTTDKAAWEFSKDTLTQDGFRTSLIRIFDDGVARDALNLKESNVLPLTKDRAEGEDVDLKAGKIPAEYAWIRASQTNFDPIFIRHTWYGSENDYGSPMYRVGMVLPVELSSFRPTLEDGKVIIHWTTESELDNAGFNIYRSETRNGEFKQVNAQLIEGAGTTGERTVYEWVDTSAKPGVVYYYQIEDVSFAGERQALAINRLKGYVSAKDKLTTRWGELKTLQ